MRYRIERIDQALFTRPVREHHVELRAAPWDDGGQRLHRLEITVDGLDGPPASHRDCFGNQVHRTALLGDHEALALRMTAEVETLLDNPFDLEPVAPARESDWIGDSLRQAPRLWDFVLARSARVPAPASVPIADDGDSEPALPAWRAGVPLLAQVQEAMGRIGELFKYDRSSSAPAASLDGLFDTRTGGAADLAHLLIAIVRGWGMPARFVTGYLDPGLFEPDDDEPDAAPRSQSPHCWMEALIPGGGWRGFDPALGLLADAGYIRVAVGRDAGDVVGFRQSFKGDGELESLRTMLSVERMGKGG